ncbi:MAG TPA: hypothetical protein VF860_10385 [Candidatus Acidoferrales bacterium]
MAQISVPRGLEQLNALAEHSRTNRVEAEQNLTNFRVLVDLLGRNLLELEGARVYFVAVEPAPDGEYQLQRSGKVLVKSGKATEVVGKADTVVSGDPTA